MREQLTLCLHKIRNASETLDTSHLARKDSLYDSGSYRGIGYGRKNTATRHHR